MPAVGRADFSSVNVRQQPGDESVSAPWSRYSIELVREKRGPNAIWNGAFVRYLREVGQSRLS
jgi:hypothetical protein